MQISQGRKSTYKQCNIEQNDNLKSKLAHDLCYENVWHVNITEPIVLQFFMYFTIILVLIMAKFYCFSSSLRPNLEANSVVSELTTRDKEYC